MLRKFASIANQVMKRNGPASLARGGKGGNRLSDKIVLQ